MKGICLLLVLTISAHFGLHAQEAVWKTSLMEKVIQKFSTTKETAKKVVDIKELHFRQIQYYSMPHVQTQMSKDEISKRVEELKKKELSNLNIVLKDEVQAKEVAAFLEGKIPIQTSQPRPR